MTFAQLMKICTKYGIDPETGDIDGYVWETAVNKGAHEYLRDIVAIVVALDKSKIGA